MFITFGNEYSQGCNWMSTFLGIILGIIAFACLYLGKGLQKYAIVGYQKKATTLGEKGKNIWIWIAGL